MEKQDRTTTVLVREDGAVYQLRRGYQAVLRRRRRRPHRHTDRFESRWIPAPKREVARGERENPSSSRRVRRTTPLRFDDEVLPR